MNYLLHILIMIGIYSIVAYSLNLTTGFCGLISLSNAVFYGIGAYVYTLTAIHLNFSFIPSLIASLIITGIIAFLIAIPALRFRGDMFVIVTLSFQMIIFTILYNWVSLTRGPYGIPAIPRPLINISFKEVGLKLSINSLFEYLILILLINLVFLSLLFILYNSPFGLALKSMREDEKVSESLGKSVFRYFLYAFVITGIFTSAAGALYASYVTYIDPTSFTIEESIFHICILLIGGSGNIKGPFAGVIFMIILPEILRFMGIPDTIAPNVRQIIYGFLLVILMFLRPRGLAGEYEIK
ncbi:MAG: branched-chain amino acid ABC transporter permease [Candidatus Hydrothermales bacterium]